MLLALFVALVNIVSKFNINSLTQLNLNTEIVESPGHLLILGPLSLTYDPLNLSPIPLKHIIAKLPENNHYMVSDNRLESVSPLFADGLRNLGDNTLDLALDKPHYPLKYLLDRGSKQLVVL